MENEIGVNEGVSEVNNGRVEVGEKNELEKGVSEVEIKGEEEVENEVEKEAFS